MYTKSPQINFLVTNNKTICSIIYCKARERKFLTEIETLTLTFDDDYACQLKISSQLLPETTRAENLRTDTTSNPKIKVELSAQQLRPH